jgi:lipopolysaccharide heptosyltransferase II
MAVPLQIPDPRERRLVRVADMLLAPVRWLPGRRPAPPVRRVLLLRLERIGDLLMVREAIRDARLAWPDAEIDLAVGAWNEEIALLMPAVTRVHVATAPWLARPGDAASWTRLLRSAGAWRRARYDVVVNFEPDIRSNLLAWLTRAPARVGYGTGGGGALLSHALAYEPRTHVSENARRLVEFVTGRPPDAGAARAALAIPAAAEARGRARLDDLARPLIGVHVSGGRPSKQWHLDRFASVARALVAERGGSVVLTGSKADRPMIDAAKTAMAGVPVRDLGGTLGLVELAAVLSELDLFVTSDTGPMHLAAAMDTPTVALFGPSNPERYGPVGRLATVVRIDLPCSPCGRVRLPPERCRGHVPDCLDGIDVSRVLRASADLLDRAAAEGRPSREPR